MAYIHDKVHCLLFGFVVMTVPIRSKPKYINESVKILEVLFLVSSPVYVLC